MDHMLWVWVGKTGVVTLLCSGFCVHLALACAKYADAKLPCTPNFLTCCCCCCCCCNRSRSVIEEFADQSAAQTMSAAAHIIPIPKLPHFISRKVLPHSFMCAGAWSKVIKVICPYYKLLHAMVCKQSEGMRCKSPCSMTKDIGGGRPMVAPTTSSRLFLLDRHLQSIAA